MKVHGNPGSRYHFRNQDHHCGLGLTSLPLTQQARVRSPVRSISWLRFFPELSLHRMTNVRKFGPHSYPVIIWPSYIIQTIYHPSRDGDRSLILAVVLVDLGFTTLWTSQVICVAFYSEREKSGKFSSEALISAWGYFTCRISTTLDPRLYIPSEGSHTKNFYALKISIDPSRVWTREPRIQWRVW